jgi:RHS repeat-associated protein
MLKNFGAVIVLMLSAAYAFCAAPNLVITSAIGVSPNPINAGNDLTVSYTVKNIGTGNAAASKTKIQVKLGSSAIITKELIVDTAALGAGLPRNDTAVVPISANVSAGNYTVYVILDYNDAIGQSDTSSASDIYQTTTGGLAIEADPGSPPIAAFSGDLRPVTGKTSTYNGGVSTGTGLSYIWTTTAGHSSFLSNPSFSFNSPGTYEILLKVTDSIGRTSIAASTIYVQAANNGSLPAQPLGADPVILAAGNYVQERVDLHLPGIGFPFEFKRFYNSKFSDQTGLPLGYGWTFNYNERLKDTGTNVLLVRGDGSASTFFPTNGGYNAEAGVFEALVRNAGDTWTLTDKHQTAKNFASNGLLLTITDRNSNTLALSYTSDHIDYIEDTSGRIIRFMTNDFGCISSIIDPIGRVFQFQYDNETNLVLVINASNQTNFYSYDSNHQMTDAVDGKGTLYVHNEYNPTNFTVLKQHDAFGNWTYFLYDLTKRVTYQTNVLGKVSVYSFDDRLLVTNIVDEAGNTNRFFYDSNRNQSLVQDRNGNQTQYAYDAIGNLTNKVDADGNSTFILYSAFNNPISRLDALNNTTAFGYDANANLATTTNTLGFITRIQHHPNGLPFVLTDARGFSTTNYYDTQGNLISIVDAKGSTNRFEYDAAGRKTNEIDALNRTNSFFYDNNDNLVCTVDALGYTNVHTYDANNNHTSVRNPRLVTITNIFDLKDRLVNVVAPLDQSVSNQFDALDRKTMSFDAKHNLTAFSYDDVGHLISITNALSQITRFTFDAEGNRTSLVDPSGHYVTNFFDVLNRESAQINISVSTNTTAFDRLGRIIGVTNANGHVSQFFYDAMSRLTNVFDAANQPIFFVYDENGNRVVTVDSNNHASTNVFDELNRLIEKRDALGNETSFRYDAVGNLTNKITANGDSVSYFYDGLNRLTNIAYPRDLSVIFSYDSVGNRTNMVDTLGQTAWKYDSVNRLVGVTDPYGNTVNYEYDANGNRTSIIYPGGKIVHYGFDSLNRLTSVTNWLEGVITYSYDDRRNLIASTNANRSIVFHDYDPANRLSSLTNFTPTGEIIACYTLVLDGVGNRLQETLEQPVLPVLHNQTNIFLPDDDNRLTSIDGLTVTHDNNGDLTQLGANSYIYDVEGRLTQFSITNTSGIYAYDGLGNRLVRTVNGETRRFVLDRTRELTQVLMETDGDGSPIAYYVYGVGLSQRIAPDGQTLTYHFDTQGSTIALSDSAGKITDSYAFDSFGVVANSDGDSPQPFRYLGQYGIMDDSNGLYYARARYFIPHLGRFLSKDSAVPIDGDSQNLHRYSYAFNNPLRYVDPSGLTPREGQIASRFNPYAGEAAYWEIYYEETKWMIPWLTAFTYAGEAAQGALAFVSAGETVAVREGIEVAFKATPTVNRIRSVAQKGFTYAVEHPRAEGLSRLELGTDANVQATRWLRRWANANDIEMGPAGLEFELRGAETGSKPDVIFHPAKQIFDFKLTSKAVRPQQSQNFKIDFPGYDIEYIFGP